MCISETHPHKRKELTYMSPQLYCTSEFTESEFLQVNNMSNNDWLSELHNGQISLSFYTCAKQTLLCWQDVVDNFNLEDYKLWFFQDSEREHIDVIDVFCGEAVV